MCEDKAVKSLETGPIELGLPATKAGPQNAALPRLGLGSSELHGFVVLGRTSTVLAAAVLIVTPFVVRAQSSPDPAIGATGTTGSAPFGEAVLHWTVIDDGSTHRRLKPVKGESLALEVQSVEKPAERNFPQMAQPTWTIRVYNPTNNYPTEDRHFILKVQADNSSNCSRKYPEFGGTLPSVPRKATVEFQLVLPAVFATCRKQPGVSGPGDILYTATFEPEAVYSGTALRAFADAFFGPIMTY